jgi:hypothetical protein
MGGNRLPSTIFATFLVWMALFSGLIVQVKAQSAVEFQNVNAVVEFGQRVTFQAVISPETTVQEAFLSIQPQGVESMILPVSVSENNEISYQMELVNSSFRPFSLVHYSFRLLLADGASVSSAEYSFEYTDQRFNWQSAGSELFNVYWYDRDLAFGQTALNVAQMGLQSIQNLLPVPSNQAVRIYIYNTANDLKGALPQSQPWIAGQSAPDLGVILLSIPIGPEDELELQRQLPHELMHVMLYRLVGEQTENLPAWLVEGLASIAEIYPNPDYANVLAKSASEDRLIPLESLCPALPRDASGAFLAYAESASFVRFLHRTYGATAIRGLVDQYKNGLGCSEGVLTGMGSSLTQLEYRWKEQELHLNAEGLIFRNLLPYLLLFLVLFGAAAVTIIVTSRRTSPHEQVVEE